MPRFEAPVTDPVIAAAMLPERLLLDLLTAVRSGKHLVAVACITDDNPPRCHLTYHVDHFPVGDIAKVGKMLVVAASGTSIDVPG